MSRSRFALRWLHAAFMLPFSWLHWYAPLIGNEWRHQRRWLDGAVCASCGQARISNTDPDPCLGRLPGVAAGCCGHGSSRRAYVLFDNGYVLRGFTRVEVPQ